MKLRSKYKKALKTPQHKLILLEKTTISQVELYIQIKNYSSHGCYNNCV